MHEDLDTPGPAELEQLADNEAGEGRMPNCQHFRRLARKWREDREDRDALRHALLQATTDKARARRAALQPDADRTAYAVVLQGDTGITLAPLCKAPACAVQALSPFEGAPVVGLATIAMEAEAISGMQYRLKHAGAAPQREAVPHTVAVRDAIHGTVEVTKVFPGDVVAEERDLRASAPVGVEGLLAEAVEVGTLCNLAVEVTLDAGLVATADALSKGALTITRLAQALAQQPAADPKLVFGLGEAKALVEFFGGSNTAVVVQHLPAGEFTDDDGKPNPAGLYAWCDECPEEGAAFLGPVDTETEEHDDVQHQAAAAAADDDAEPRELCESGLPDCGAAVAWDRDGIGACERCAKELGWIAGQQHGGSPT